MAGARGTLLERFMRHVEKTDSCWLWTGYRLPHGYGSYKDHGWRTRPAHSIAFELFSGPIPAGMEVMHSCDVRACVNPAHLSLGSRMDNMRDAKAKGRTARGSGHGRSTLTEAEVRFILDSPLFQREIARLLGISQGHVSAIKAGKKWAHLAQESRH